MSESTAVEPRAHLDLSARINAPGVRDVAVADLYLSDKNPRKVYPEESLLEMTESMRQHGFFPLKFIVARPNACERGLYEIAGGHRRRIAAERAGLTHIPALIQEMDDAKFREILNTDNAASEPIHPLYEADGWRDWIAESGVSVADIAAHLGKKPAYVYKRVQLATRLIPEGREAWLAGRIEFGHAEQIMRLEPKDQKRALQACEPPQWASDAPPVSTRTLADWIKKNLNQDMEASPFLLADPALLPSAGACTECPHRVGNLPDFDPLQDLPNVCMQPACYEQKLAAHIEAEKVRLQEALGYLLCISFYGEPRNPAGSVPHSDWRNAPAGHPHAKLALLIDGPDAGRNVSVIVTERVEEPPAPALAPPAPARAAKPDPQQATAEKQEREREALRLKREALAREKREQEARELVARETSVRAKLLNAILDKVTWPPPKEWVIALCEDWLGEVHELLIPTIQAQGVQAITGRQEWAKVSEDRIARLVAICALNDDFDEYSIPHGAKQLDAAAKRYGVDIAAVRKRATLEYVVEASGIDFDSDLIRLEVGKKELVEIKFVGGEEKTWVVYCDISLPVKGSEGYGQHGPLRPTVGTFWKDRGAAFDAAFAHFAKFAASVDTYAPATEATRTAAEEVRAWVTRGMAARAAMVALAPPAKDARKAAIGKLPALNAKPAPAKSAPAAKKAAAPAKKAAKAAPAKKIAPAKKGKK